MKYLIVVLSIISAVLAQTLLKKSSYYDYLEIRWIALILSSILAYVIAFALQIYILRIFQLNKISPVMSMGIMILVVMAGIIFFKESMNVKQIIGILLGLISIYLILN